MKNENYLILMFYLHKLFSSIAAKLKRYNLFLFYFNIHIYFLFYTLTRYFIKKS